MAQAERQKARAQAVCGPNSVMLCGRARVLTLLSSLFVLVHYHRQSRGSLIQVAAPHVDQPLGIGPRLRSDSGGGSRAQLGSMASLVGVRHYTHSPFQYTSHTDPTHSRREQREYELVTDSEADYSESDADMTADTDLSDTDFSGSGTDVRSPSLGRVTETVDR
jgi:hypothetical protein